MRLGIFMARRFVKPEKRPMAAVSHAHASSDRLRVREMEHGESCLNAPQSGSNNTVKRSRGNQCFMVQTLPGYSCC